MWAEAARSASSMAAMWALAATLLSALLLTQVNSAVLSVKDFGRKGGSLSLVLEIEVQSHPAYTNNGDYKLQAPTNSVCNVQGSEVSLAQIKTEDTAIHMGRQIYDQRLNQATLDNKLIKTFINRTKTTDVQPKMGEGGNTQGRTSALPKLKIEHGAAEKQVLVAGDRKSSPVLETKPLDVPQERPKVLDVRTEGRQDGDVPSRAVIIAQNKTQHTTQKQTLTADDRKTSTSVKTKLLEVDQARPEVINVEIKMIQSGNIKGNKDAPAKLKVEHEETQKQDLAAGDKMTNTFLETKPFGVTQKLREHTAGQTERRQDGDMPRKKTLAQAEFERTTQRQAPAVDERNSAFLATKPSETVREQTGVTDVHTERRRNGEVQESKKSLEPSLDDNGLGTTLIENGKDINKILKGSKETESSRTSAPRQATGSNNATVTSILSEAPTRRTIQERNDEMKDAVQTTPLSLVLSLERKEVLRQAATTTEGGVDSWANQLEPYVAPRDGTDQNAAAKTDREKITEDLISGRGTETSITRRSFMLQDADGTEVGLETPAKLLVTPTADDRPALKSVRSVADATTPGGAVRIRRHPNVPDESIDDEGSARESDVFAYDY